MKRNWAGSHLGCPIHIKIKKNFAHEISEMCSDPHKNIPTMSEAFLLCLILIPSVLLETKNKI